MTQPIYRLYIDESGTHHYKHIQGLQNRYLALTGLLFMKAYYDQYVPDALEKLKKRYFSYDPDMPPVLHKDDIVAKRGVFRVLLDPAVNQAWEQDVIALFSGVAMQMFTVVIDKVAHLQAHPTNAWNPYDYSLEVLLNRVKGYLGLRNATADVMPESRGRTEDNQLLAAYTSLRTSGDYYATASDYASAYPLSKLLFRRKDQNVAGLQLADLLVADQAIVTLQQNGAPSPRQLGSFSQQLAQAVAAKVNQYGRYLLI